MSSPSWDEAKYLQGRVEELEQKLHDMEIERNALRGIIVGALLEKDRNPLTPPSPWDGVAGGQTTTWTKPVGLAPHNVHPTLSGTSGGSTGAVTTAGIYPDQWTVTGNATSAVVPLSESKPGLTDVWKQMFTGGIRG